MFKPKFPSFRERLIAFAIVVALYGIVLSFRMHCYSGYDALVVASILALAAIIPESAPKPKPEDYGFTEKEK